MKIALNKRGKIVVIQNKNKQQRPQKKWDTYDYYKMRGKENKIYILEKGELEQTYDYNKSKGRLSGSLRENIDTIVRWQKQGNQTDRQFTARLHAAQLIDPTMSRKRFLEEQGWEAVDDLASQLNEDLKNGTNYSGLNEGLQIVTDGTKRASIISEQVYGS